MGVYERADSPYWWIWLDGTARRFSSRIPVGKGAAKRDSQAEAETVYRAAMGDLARKRFVIPTDRPPRTFREHATWYRDTISIQHRSVKQERCTVNRLIAHFGDAPLHAIDGDAIEEWKTARATEVQKPTVNRELDVLKPLFDAAVPKYLEESPTAKVFRFKVNRFPPVTTLTEEAEDKLLEAATTEERAVVILALDTLVRMGDCRRLKRSDDHGTHLDITDPKTVTTYTVPVSARLRQALDALSNTGSPYYFSRIYGGTRKAISAVTMHDLFVDLCRKAGVPNGRKSGGVTFHSLRHTGASRASRHVKLSVVKRLGNWASLVMLDRYDHPDDPELLRAVEAIGSRDTHTTARSSKTLSKSATKS